MRIGYVFTLSVHRRGPVVQNFATRCPTDQAGGREGSLIFFFPVGGSLNFFSEFTSGVGVVPQIFFSDVTSGVWGGPFFFSWCHFWWRGAP